MSFRLDDPTYELAAKAALPKLRAALEGKLPVPPQAVSTEGWLALAMFYDDNARPGFLEELDDILSTAEYVNDAIPDWAEVAEAFLRLRARGWLAEKDDRWGLTPKGRDAIREIVTARMVQESLDQLNGWLASHPAP